MADATLRIKALDGGWETLGSDRQRGIISESVEAKADHWGPSELSFSVKALPQAERTDLLPFTPVELEVGGILCWAGYVWQRPSADNEYQVGCRGWQFHLTDDLVDRVYVHTRLGDYRDARSFLTEDLSLFTVAGVVTVDDGSIVIGWPNGAVLPANGRVGVTFDLGPDSTGKRAVMTWDSTNNSAATTCYIGGTDGESFGSAGETAASFLMNSGASGTTSGTFATARRYMHVILSVGAGGATLTADLHLRIKSLKVFRATAYESANASILKAHQVIEDLLASAPLLSQDTGLVSDGTFSLPEFFTAGYQEPKQIMEAVNAVESYCLKIGGPYLNQLVFDAKPTAPLYEAGEWSGASFSDASVSGEEIFDKAIVEATGPDGAQLVETRTQTGTLNSRRGQTRAKVIQMRSAATSLIMQRVGDLWLAEHETAPFAGTLSGAGAGMIRKHQGGEQVPAQAMLLAAGEKIRLTNQIDPDTGAMGRDGRIAGVTYRPRDESLSIAIDDRRESFERVLERYGALVGSS